MKKLTKYFLPGLLLLFLVISGLAVYRQLSNFTMTDLTFYDDELEKEEAEKKEAVYQKKQLELKRLITSLDANLMVIFNQLNLTVMPAGSQKEKVVVLKDRVFSWQQDIYQITVPTFARNPQEILEMKLAIVEKLSEQGHQLISSQREDTPEKLQERLFIGFQNDQLQVITHQLVLTKVIPKAQLALIIDDLGYDWSGLAKMLTIPRPITFAVLPDLPQSNQQARRVLAGGYDLILHQPMEPLAELDPGKGAIYLQMTAEEIIEILKNNLSILPEEIIGVNNHMGSKVTADSQIMEIVLQYFKARGLFFIDSSTTPYSVVEEVAREIGEPYQKNDIFLDNIDELSEIKHQVFQAGQLALRNGQAVAIGHVRTNTALGILTMIDQLEDMGIQLVYVQDLIYE